MKKTVLMCVLLGWLVGCEAEYPDFVIQGGWQYHTHLTHIDGHDYRFVVQGDETFGEVGLLTLTKDGHVLDVKWQPMSVKSMGTTVQFIAPIGNQGQAVPVQWELKLLGPFDLAGHGQGELKMLNVPGSKPILIDLEKRPWTFAEEYPVLSVKRVVIEEPKAKDEK